MATDTSSIINTINNSTVSGSAATSSSSNTSSSASTSKDIMGKDDFLKLLVTQLKNQDPMDPMKNDQFAVNLAQFSQLEQLISINGKIGDQGGSASDFSSLASYLGTQITLNGDSIHVNNKDGGMLKVNLPQDVVGMQVELKDASGKVQETESVGAMSAGDQTISMNGLTVPNGDYSVTLTATTAAGGTFQPTFQVAGIVSGFVPGADPTLIVGGREVKPADVASVNIPPSAAQ